METAGKNSSKGKEMEEGKERMEGYSEDGVRMETELGEEPVDFAWSQPLSWEKGNEEQADVERKENDGKEKRWCEFWVGARMSGKEVEREDMVVISDDSEERNEREFYDMAKAIEEMESEEEREREGRGKTSHIQLRKDGEGDMEVLEQRNRMDREVVEKWMGEETEGWKKLPRGEASEMGRRTKMTKIQRMRIATILQKLDDMTSAEIVKEMEGVLREAEEARLKSPNIQGVLDSKIKVGLESAKRAIQKLAERVDNQKERGFTRERYIMLVKENKDKERELKRIGKTVKELEETVRNYKKDRAEREEGKTLRPRIKSVAIRMPGQGWKLEHREERMKGMLMERGERIETEREGLRQRRESKEDERKKKERDKEDQRERDGWRERAREWGEASTSREGGSRFIGGNDGRGRKGRKRKSGGFEMENIRFPKMAAVTVTCRGEKMSYEEVIKRARSEINLERLGIENTKMRKTRTGGILIEIPGKDTVEKANELANKMREVFWSEENIKIGRPKRMTGIRVTNLDVSVTQEEIAEELGRKGECGCEEVKVGEIKRMGNGMGVVSAQCPSLSVGKIMRKGRKIRIGWTEASIEVMEKKPVKCFKCLAYGHLQAECQYKGKAGHLIVTTATKRGT